MFSPRKRPKRHSWTLSHGFYACMGGYALDITDLSPGEEFLSVPEKRWTCTKFQLYRLLDDYPDLLPDLSKEEISEKSKASMMAKTLVCLQALWFSAQCLSRLVEGLPISLLELNTFGHAVCTVVIYLLWWEKPFDVEGPTLVRGTEVNELIARSFIEVDPWGEPNLWRVKHFNYIFEKDKESTFGENSAQNSPIIHTKGLFLFCGETIPGTTFKAVDSGFVHVRVLNHLGLIAQSFHEIMRNPQRYAPLKPRFRIILRFLQWSGEIIGSGCSWGSFLVLLSMEVCMHWRGMPTFPPIPSS